MSLIDDAEFTEDEISSSKLYDNVNNVSKSSLDKKTESHQIYASSLKTVAFWVSIYSCIVACCLNIWILVY